MHQRSSYSAKVLLFGEHIVLKGAVALAVPYPTFNLRWVKRTETDVRLLQFCAFLQANSFEKWLELARLKNDLKNGWQLIGNVPQGYGLGSSGTVCAAIWGRFATIEGQKLSLPDLRNAFSAMEAFYHGSSSGTDPLISYVNRPVRLSAGPPEPVDLPDNWQQSLFLLDTGQPRQSSKLIDTFLTRYTNDADWRNKLEESWISASEACIGALLNGDQKRLELYFFAISNAQLKLVPDFIPETVKTVWHGDSYCLKLCGAGGGGFMLGYSTDWEKTQQELAVWTLYTI